MARASNKKQPIKISLEDLMRFERVHVLVVGDVMLDRYWHGDTNRISPEAPVPIVNISHFTSAPGGAANVASNIADLGAQITLCGLIGQDQAAEELQQLLEDLGVDCQLQVSPKADTTVKTRVLSRQQQMLRIDFERPQAFSNHSFDPSHAKSLIEACDVLILSDYAKGMLAQPQFWIALARDCGKPVLVDPKGLSFKNYQGASVLTPNRLEFERVVGACKDLRDFEARGSELLADIGVERLLVTCGSEGMIFLPGGREALRVQANAREVFDVTGAGDTAIAVLGVALAAKFSWEASVCLANIAAGAVVGKLGSATIDCAELAKFLDN